MTAHVLGSDNVTPKRGAALAERYDGTRDGVTVRAGGLTVANDQISNQISHDLSLAESVAIPLTLVALVFVFGSFVAALLPLAVGGIGHRGDAGRAQAVDALRAGVRLRPQPHHRPRPRVGHRLQPFHREPLPGGTRPGARAWPDAVQVAVRSAGRTVLFSSVTVGLSHGRHARLPVLFPAFLRLRRPGRGGHRRPWSCRRPPRPAQCPRPAGQLVGRPPHLAALAKGAFGPG